MIKFSLTDEVLARTGQAGTIGLVAFFDGPLPALEELRARVAERWGSLHRLRLAAQPPPRGYRQLTGRHQWAITSGFDPAVHVSPAVDISRPHQGQPDGNLNELLISWLQQPMPLDQPSWRVIPVRDTADAGWALVLLAHHALLDGASLVTLMGLLMDNPPALPGPSTPSPREAHKPSARWSGAGAARALRAELRRGTVLPHPADGLPRPEVALVTLNSDDLKAVRSLGALASPSALLLALSAGAVRTVFHPTQTSGWNATTGLHTTVPVDLRTRATRNHLGNLVSTARIPVPVHEPTPQGRLAAARQLLADIHAEGADQQNLVRVIERLNRIMLWALGPMATHGCSPQYAALGTTTVRVRMSGGSLLDRRLQRCAGLMPLHQPGTIKLCTVVCGTTVMLTVVSHAHQGAAQDLADAAALELRLLAVQ